MSMVWNRMRQRWVKLRWNEGKDHGTELTRAMAMVRSPAWAKKPSWGGGTGWSQERMAAMAWKCEGLCNYSARPWWARTAVIREKRNEPLLTKINTSIHSHSFFPPTKHKQR